MGEISLWKSEDSVALLDETCLACNTIALHVAGVGGVGYLRISVGTLACRTSLYPCRHVEGEDIRTCSFLYGDLCVVGLAHDDVLIVEL